MTATPEPPVESVVVAGWRVAISVDHDGWLDTYAEIGCAWDQLLRWFTSDGPLVMLRYGDGTWKCPDESHAEHGRNLCRDCHPEWEVLR